MIESFGNLFTEPCDALVIPTNTQVKPSKDGPSGRVAVMGKGVALQAARLYPTLPFKLADRIVARGSEQIHVFTPSGVFATALVCLPTKYHWRDPAALVLIGRMLDQLIAVTNALGWNTIVLPRLGCGAGGLDWQTQVRPAMSALLDDRFVVVHPAEEDIPL